MNEIKYDEFLRNRITELRLRKNVSEHRMSLDLDKSGSYIRSISNGAALPSVRELFNIIAYFDMTPAEFFAPLESTDTLFGKLCTRLRSLGEEELEKVLIFIDLIDT